LKTLNVDSSLLIDEIIGGGDGLAYKARKGSRRGSTIKDKFLKLFGVEPKPAEPEAASAPPVLTRDQLEMKEMDQYYTNFNWELPDQKPMTMPPTAMKGKRSRSNSAAVCSGPSSPVHSSNVNSCHTLDDPPMSPLRQDIIPESPLEEERDLIPQVSQDYNQYGTTDNSKVLADGIKEEDEEVGIQEFPQSKLPPMLAKTEEGHGATATDIAGKGVDPSKPGLNSDVDSVLQATTKENAQLVSDRAASSELGR
jgi:hypothetical protein